MGVSCFGRGRGRLDACESGVPGHASDRDHPPTKAKLPQALNAFGACSAAVVTAP